MSVDITSTANPHIKDLATLKTRRGRARSGRFLIEGRRELQAALDAGIIPDEVVLCQEAAGDGVLALDLPGPVIRVGVAVFAKLSVRQNPDGVLGVATTWTLALDAVTTDLVLITESIEKPGNLGAMLRTADAAGAAVVVADPTVDVFNPNVIRASRGALFSVPVAVTSTEAATAWASGRGAVVVTSPEAGRPLWEMDLTGPVSIVIGSEHAGVSEAWREVGTTASIPMAGTADSLNASVTAGIALFEAVRQRSSR